MDFINHVALNSRLLGFNAAIEAARAVEYGRGFAVVADEIRKMAENNAKSVNDTKKILFNINNKVEDLFKKIRDLSDVALTQAVATREIATCLQNFEAGTQIMQKISAVI
ncbi:methyl-accepting chemotaxis protein [Desulfosporosinus sp. SB140]|uniref:methyl-accepting chemotaxis protein n=1 Tax=Desulfosporosinus paludis TaxID=3115649 RepID=UPI00388F7367